ncbi:MAG TPA: hypothetical protein VNM48_01360 [Chloroflexota bacterium]|nr:hypothetical protein [Chloroflexota bacterium]
MSDATSLATQAIRPLITRSRAELERAVIEAARAFCLARCRDSVTEDRAYFRLYDAVTNLDEWEQLREEAAAGQGTDR